MNPAPQARPEHPIQVVSKRTGLSPDVIRVWEKRYGAVEPTRSATNRRLYTDEQIERLVLLRRATLMGRSISSVAGLETGRLRQLIEEDERAAARAPQPGSAWIETDRGGHVDACLGAVEDFDPHRLRGCLRRATLGLGAAAMMDQVLLPLLRTIGERWTNGTLAIAHEHMASGIIRALLESMRDAQEMSFPGAVIVVATPAGERHEMGALMVSAVAAAEGWQVVHLGPDVPAAEIARAAVRRGARAVAVSVVYPQSRERVADELRTLGGSLPPGVRVLVGGAAAAGYEEVVREIGAVRIPDLQELRAALEGLRATS